MHKWISDYINMHRGQLVSRGQPVPQYYQLVVRFLGREAASGAKQMLCTASDLQTAQFGFQATYGWWTPVPEVMDSRGWRWVHCRWFDP